MNTINKISRYLSGHRIQLAVVLCLFGLCVAQSRKVAKGRHRPKTDERVYLKHADMLRFNQYGEHAGAQILNGNVAFLHKGALLTCDSAYFYQESNSFKAFGHVKMRQGDTLSLTSDYAFYDGDNQMAEARHNVLLRHRGTKLYTDSLNYDRLYNIGYFFEGGKMVDRNNVLVSDWGEYDTETRKAVFNYNVNLRNPKFTLTTDTLHYDTRTSLANIVGPSVIRSKESVIHTSEGYYNTNTGRARLYGRSTMSNKGKEITGDSLFYDEKRGISQGYRNVIYKDTQKKNELHCNYLWYNEKNGFAFATENPVMMEYSQKDTLFVHSDTIKVITYHLNTDSVYRTAHCYNKVRAFRNDVQAVCDSLVYNTKDSCMTMYRDPIAWSGDRQLLGEEIQVFMKDSTIDRAHIINQALTAELMPDKEHYQQLSSKEMFAYFTKGQITQTEAIGNVRSIYYPVDDKDSTLMGLVYIETDTMKMFMRDRQLQKIWTSKTDGTWYPMTQIPPERYKLDGFTWFDYIRPINKDDIYEWRGKKDGTQLKNITRHAAPLQHIEGGELKSVAATENKPEN
ncbi:MAG: OstA-like protein [Prevotella pectinovora]|uniref:OstA-like protein n=1 Tax=Prevotella pectinovora TaxID=1602169 RepID=UPI002A8194A7|nr:OstA-like protein [Prevotella pectinovora]MDY4778836.1 OstA-like protein [Prevotella pectinovora]